MKNSQGTVFLEFILTLFLLWVSGCFLIEYTRYKLFDSFFDTNARYLLARLTYARNLVLAEYQSNAEFKNELNLHLTDRIQEEMLALTQGKGKITAKVFSRVLDGRKFYFSFHVCVPWLTNLNSKESAEKKGEFRDCVGQFHQSASIGYFHLVRRYSIDLGAR